MNAYRNINAWVYALYILTITLLNLQPNPAVAAQIAVFGPEKYAREVGGPQKIVKSFSVSNTEGEFTLVVQNGEGKRGRVSSAVIQLNGVTVVGPNAFNKKIDLIAKTVALQKENQLTIEVRSEPGSSIIVSITGEGTPPPSPVTGVTVAPDGFPVNTPTQVSFTATIPYPIDKPVPLVEIVRVSPTGEVLNVEGQMVDDGNLSLGDEIDGDGVFSLRKTYNFSDPSTISLKVRANLEGQVYYSDAFNVFAFAPLTEEQANEMDSVESTAHQLLVSLIQTEGNQKALEETLKYIQSQPIVQKAGISEGAVSIWIKYTNGIRAVVFYNPPGTRGAINASPFSKPNSQTESSPLQDITTNALLPGNTEIGNTKVLILSPFLWDFQTSNSDEGPELQSLYQDHNTTNSCPTYDITYLSNTQAGVGSFKALGSYGIVHIVTHGTLDSGRAVVVTGTKATTQNQQTYLADLNAERLVRAEGYLAVTPAFFTYYIQTMPSSLVFISSCYSTYNNNMANALLAKGAKSYLGFSNLVPTNFAHDKATYFHQNWIEDTTALVTTGEIFNGGCSDAACWNLLGANNLETSSGELQDGGFEDTALGAVWWPQGDGRIVYQLGGTFSPTEGARMGLVSTGLGFTNQSGSLEQKACIPANATTLSFDWNFNSEEFQEYCGSVYQDYFSVDLIDQNGATTNVFRRKVDDVCAGTYSVPFAFDVGGVYSTGWKNQAVDISSFAANNAGKQVTIRFSAGDVGDSIYDTAILLDDIKINTP